MSVHLTPKGSAPGAESDVETKAGLRLLSPVLFFYSFVPPTQTVVTTHTPMHAHKFTVQPSDPLGPGRG
ncbi:hypothetical protein D623_10014964 [Myotis brandtii]|uniref:Uncharacterized protein n=1 Tax=Myotis brandtii TaxID=109478 RepID=S7PX90_MYOBR|nr:hypothetical protein D623_10014964 [Myotis brandtii]